VFSVFDQARGIDDDEILRIALENERILTTMDKDFGEKIFREKRAHYGVILLRLKDERSKIKLLQWIVH
jgi:predicted nuclease of predicted toxin-antitoxin system